MQTLTDNDRNLIQAAKRVSYLDWDAIYPMIEEADTYDAKEQLHKILRQKALEEEAACGCI